MKIFVSGGDDTVTENALRLVLDTVKDKHQLVLVACSKACPMAGVIERWAWGKNILSGRLSAQSPEVFWDMVDSVIAMPGTPQSLLDSAKEFNKPIWEPFKAKEA